MRGAPAHQSAPGADQLFIIEIAGHEARCQSEAAHRFHHEHREIPAAPGFQSQRLRGFLDPHFLPPGVVKIALDGLGHGDENVEGIAIRRGIDEGLRPLIHRMLRVRKLPLLGARQIRAVVGTVIEG